VRASERKLTSLGLTLETEETRINERKKVYRNDTGLNLYEEFKQKDSEFTTKQAEASAPDADSAKGSEES
jgi:cell fate (sporulation/competence/biofilm development) regulator YlbF (YheA/YmcA/DUF963 family)